MTLTYDHIAALALSHGFKLKPQPDGRMALNDYVLDFARAVYQAGHAAAKAETAAAVAKERERAAQFCDRRQAELLALVPGARRSNIVRMHEACANTAEVLAQAIRAGAKEPSDAPNAATAHHWRAVLGLEVIAGVEAALDAAGAPAGTLVERIGALAEDAARWRAFSARAQNGD